jgi:hypothetical protein
MTRTEILKAALAAAHSDQGDIHDLDSWNFWDEQLIRFASAIAAAERERCAKVCDERSKQASSRFINYVDRMMGAEDCAATIRALTDGEERP